MSATVINPVPAQRSVDEQPSPARQECPANRPVGFARDGRGYSLVRIGLGLFLLTTAGLKLYGLNVSVLPRVGWFASPQVQFLAVEWEIILGVWLLSGSHLVGSCIAAFGTFAVFAMISAYLIYLGVSSCGCFGTLMVRPEFTFFLDAAILALLVKTCPAFNLKKLRFERRAAIIPIWTAGILISTSLVGSMVYGSFPAALAKVRGDTLTLSADYLDFGSAKAGQKVERTIDVHNWSDVPAGPTH